MLEPLPAFDATVGVNRQLNQAVHRLPLPSGASITPEARRRIYWTMVWVPPECSVRSDRATTNTIVQWLWGETHASIMCALFADVIKRSRTGAMEARSHRSSRSPS